MHARVFTVFTEKKFVAQKKGRIGGYAQARYTTAKEAGEIRNLCVRPKDRSKGIEEMLITAAFDEIKKVGTKKVFLI